MLLREIAKVLIGRVNMEFDEKYQSEDELEKELIESLSKSGYEYVSIKDSIELEANFRSILNKVNKDRLNGQDITDREFDDIINKIKGKTVLDSALILRDELEIKREKDDSSLFIVLLDKNNWDKNYFQVSNQISVRGIYSNRYDVTILINGLPLVQIELKRRGLDMKEAFNQICRYKDHSFTGLFRFLQIFVVSNGVDTRYFSNANYTKDLNYKFTFTWTNRENKKLYNNLFDFTGEFLRQDHLVNMISKYMVIKKKEEQILILRPYQVYAVEAIVNKALNTKEDGYVWHTTGSGKTLTSFKVSQILSGSSKIDKVFFLVDRQDLDEQTEREFNEFQPGSVDGTDSTGQLISKIKDPFAKIIITTIQKMSNAIRNERYENIMADYKDKKVIFVIDECHRSQFGKMHRDIRRHFKNSQFFGFTGTPILPENLTGDGRTTADIFGECLHYYLIINAIDDGNVLGFNVEYINTLPDKYKNEAAEEVNKLLGPNIWSNEDRMRLIVENIIDNHDRYSKNDGFNAIFAVDSIASVIEYYDLFKEMNHDLKVSAIFSYETNQDLSGDKVHDRESMDRIMSDFNKTFKTSHSTEEYKLFRSDIDKKIRTGQLDILIVMNMFLTGFDSKKINTLYLDKTLKTHNLIQAYSRTNRVLNDTKPYGNIISYRNLKNATDDALKMFSKSDDINTVLAKPYEELLKDFKKQLDVLYVNAKTPEDVDKLKGQKAKRDFVVAFRDLTKILIKLEKNQEFRFRKDHIGIGHQEYQDFKSKYFKIADETKTTGGGEPEKPKDLEDIDFAIEIMQRDKIDFDYIMNLLGNIDLSNEETRNNDIEYILKKLKVATDTNLRAKSKLLQEFLENIVPSLDKDASIQSEYIKYRESMMSKRVIEFSNKNNIDYLSMMELIDRYQTTGVINVSRINKLLSESNYSFQEIYSKSHEVEDFITLVSLEFS